MTSVDLVNLLLANKDRLRITVKGHNVTYQGRVLIGGQAESNVLLGEKQLKAVQTFQETWINETNNATGNYTSVDGKYIMCKGVPGCPLVSLGVPGCLWVPNAE